MEETKVVIADDSPLMRALLKKILSENNIEVIAEAKNGEEAVELFEKHKPHLKRGTQVLKEILEKYPDANIVMVSSVSDAKVVMQCLKTGAKRYIMKPFDEKAVLSAVNKVIKQKPDTSDSQDL
jgi:two-component system chemotaxis response regulator CheY